MKIQRSSDFKFTEKFNDLRDSLVSEFLTEFSRVSAGSFYDSQPLNPEDAEKQKEENSVGWWKPIEKSINKAPWKVKAIKYTNPEGEVWWGPDRFKFPTALKLTESFGDSCPIVTYSLLEANSSIKRHIGIENHQSKYARCHIPLIVPEGDIGLEVEDEVVRWDNCFAFNNQKQHSAWNRTDYRRLVLTIDLDRQTVDWPEPSI